MNHNNYSKSDAIIVMEYTNIIGTIIMVITGFVLMVYSDYGSHPFLWIGLGVIIVSVISYFYGKLFTNAAYDIQITRQATVALLNQSNKSEQSNFPDSVNMSFDKYSYKNQQDGAVGSSKDYRMKNYE